MALKSANFIFMEYILAFGSAHKALKAEEILKEASVPFRLLPSPKALAPYCDLVISMKEESLLDAKEALRNSGLEPKTIYRKEGEEYVAL